MNFSTIFISVFGENITSQRIPYFFFWILSCIMCVKITEVFSGHNFTKFLVSKDGTEIKRFGPKTEPEEIKKNIEELLNV